MDKLKCYLITIVLTLAGIFSLSMPARAEEDCCTLTVGEDTVSYTSFQKAWSDAVNKGKTSDVTITLQSDWIADNAGSFGTGDGFQNGALVYSGAHNLTLDLNGHALDRNLYAPTSNGAVLYLSSTMVIMDSGSGDYTCSNLFKGGVITNGANSGNGGGIVIQDGGSLSFNGGTILNCMTSDHGGAIYLGSENAVLSVAGGAFFGNRTIDSVNEARGGAIYCTKGKTILENAVFEGNYSENEGGAIAIDGGTLECKQCSFYGNYAKEDGGAIFITGDAYVKISDTSFFRNETDDDGGALYCDSDDGTYLYDCIMNYNTAKAQGGAIHVNEDKVFIIGGDIEYNTAGDNGGGVYVNSMHDVNAAGKLIIKNNEVSGKENDLCLQDGIATTAYLYCGGFYAGSSIGICSNDTDSQLAIKGIDKYQYANYIFFDEGFQQDKVISSAVSQEGIRAVASAFVDSNLVVIGVCGLVAVLVLVIAVIFSRKKKKGGKNE